MTKVAQEIVKVRAHWDNQDSSNEGWYAVAYARGADQFPDIPGSGELYEADDSMKMWFPVDLDGYDQGQSDDVREALVAAFPDAEIEVQS